MFVAQRHDEMKKDENEKPDRHSTFSIYLD
jgi:hypothetical protein